MCAQEGYRGELVVMLRGDPGRGGGGEGQPSEGDL